MRRRPRLLTAAALALVVVLPAGCTSVKNGLGPRESICFSVIPTARAEVGKGPYFAGVRYVGPTTIVRAIERVHHHKVMPPSPLLGRDAHHADCMVAFRSHRFRGRLMAHAWRPGEGPYHFVIVVVRLRTHRILAVIVLHKAPIGFGDLV